jgi:hypothetical protein
MALVKINVMKIFSHILTVLQNQSRIIFQLEPKSRIQGCGSGSGSGLDPDSMGCLDPDSESGSGSRGKKKKKIKKKSKPLY